MRENAFPSDSKYVSQYLAANGAARPNFVIIRGAKIVKKESGQKIIEIEVSISLKKGRELTDDQLEDLIIFEEAAQVANVKIQTSDSGEPGMPAKQSIYLDFGAPIEISYTPYP